MHQIAGRFDELGNVSLAQLQVLGAEPVRRGSPRKQILTPDALGSTLGGILYSRLKNRRAQSTEAVRL
jgi:hypothetical protein